MSEPLVLLREEVERFFHIARERYSILLRKRAHLGDGGGAAHAVRI